ncbi:hypothetical protein [Treponema sp. J25]|uniref:hypothetical protein n=1 Tax=Treponema sp. J25 TaxID=2094121 RepID=UPI00104D6542|nr:hypothetical protein [Treponema sp. J25]
MKKGKHEKLHHSMAFFVGECPEGLWLLESGGIFLRNSRVLNGSLAIPWTVVMMHLSLSGYIWLEEEEEVCT